MPTTESISLVDLDFTAADLFDALENADDDALNRLDYGVVRMSSDNAVTSYNNHEAELSGLPASRVEGRNFFTEVAPCTHNFMVAHRFEAEDALDDCIPYTFTFKMAPTRVTLRLLKRDPTSSRYLLVRKAE